MVTRKQLNANRKNAKKGGVKTAAGKAKSRYNASKHGVLSKEVLLSTENAKDFNQFEAGLVAAYKPRDDAQRSFVDIIVSALWRKRRAIRCEREAIESDIELYFRSCPYIRSDIIIRYEAALDKQMYRALMELQALQRLDQPEIQVEET